MSYHGKLQVLKNGTADAEIQLWAYHQLEKELTLTDEEIEEVYRNVEQDFALTESKKPDGGWRNFPVELGRAILRKAQEK
jgi:oligoendopeptidase F